MAEASKPTKKLDFSMVTRYFKEVKAELKKVVWPTTKQTVNNTIVVLVSIAIVGVLIFGLDTGLTYLLGILLKK